MKCLTISFSWPRHLRMGGHWLALSRAASSSRRQRRSVGYRPTHRLAGGWGRG